MKSKNIIILFCLVMLGANATGQSAFTIDEACAYALQHSKAVEMDKLTIADADGQINEYLSIGIPKINGTVKYTYFFDIPTSIFPDFLSPAIYGVLVDENLVEDKPREAGSGIPAQFGTPNQLDAGVDLLTLLLDGSYIIGLRAQKLYRELILKRTKETDYSVKSKVVEAYLSVLTIDKNATLLEDNIQNLNKLFQETSAIYESGFAEKLDVDRLALSLKNLENERDNLLRLSELSKYALKYQMGFPSSEEITLSESFDDLKNSTMVLLMDEKPNLDLGLRPESASFETAIQLQQINVNRYKYSYLPSLYGFASYSGSLQRTDLFDSNDNNWFKTSLIGLQLNVPIFDGLEKRAKIQRAKISKAKTILQKEMFEEGLELQVNTGWLKYENAKNKVTNNEEAMDLAKEIYRVTQIKFKEGVGSSLEVSQAEAELYRSQSNYTNAVYELITANNELSTVLGKL